MYSEKPSEILLALVCTVPDKIEEATVDDIRNHGGHRSGFLITPPMTRIVWRYRVASCYSSSVISSSSLLSPTPFHSNGFLFLPVIARRERDQFDGNGLHFKRL